jgi:hypothetical protein
MIVHYKKTCGDYVALLENDSNTCYSMYSYTYQYMDICVYAWIYIKLENTTEIKFLHNIYGYIYIYICINVYICIDIYTYIQLMPQQSNCSPSYCLRTTQMWLNLCEIIHVYIHIIYTAANYSWREKVYTYIDIDRWYFHS